MSGMASTLVLPGESLSLPSSSSLTLGPGIVASVSRTEVSVLSPHAESSTAPRLVATKMGILGSGKGKEKGEMMWVEGRSKRYIPAQRELVLGTVIARHAEGYRVDIGSAQMASLDALAFEGATKRSKPNLKVGTLIFGRVSLANRDMEPEIECFDASTGKSEGFGELKGGLMVQLSLEMCRQLLSPKFPLLPTLAAHFPFETAIGMNGRVWVKAASVGEMIALHRILKGVDDGEVAVEKGELDKLARSLLA